MSEPAAASPPRDTPAEPAQPELSTQERLLEAAAALMTERGSIDIRLSDIAERSGMNSALVKYHFGHKAGLLLALVRRVTSPGIVQLQALADMDINPEIKLRHHIQGIVNTYFRHPFLNRLLMSMFGHENELYARTLAEELVWPVAEAQRRILEHGVRTGHFRQVDPMMFYISLTGACDALFYNRSTLRHGFGVSDVTKDMKQAYADYLCTLLLQGVLKPTGTASAR